LKAIKLNFGTSSSSDYITLPTWVS